MAFYNKIGLLVLSEDATRFLVCQKFAENVTADYIMPGGKNDEGDDRECLKNEIKQELGCAVDFASLRFIGTYEDEAAGRPDRTVEIRLYSGNIIGDPKPSTEIENCTGSGRKRRMMIAFRLSSAIKSFQILLQEIFLKKDIQRSRVYAAYV